MNYHGMPDASLSTRELLDLERALRRDLRDVAAARASCASLRIVTDRDEQEILRLLARIELLLTQKSSWQVRERCTETAFA
jgi:hypothetical protein